MGSRLRYERVSNCLPSDDTPSGYASLSTTTTSIPMSTNMHPFQVAAIDTDEPTSPLANTHSYDRSAIPSSPPPSFRSRNSSRRVSRDDEAQTPAERNLHDAFDAPSDEDTSEDEDSQNTRRLIPSDRTPTLSPSDEDNASPSHTPRPTTQRTVTSIPIFTPPTSSSTRAQPAGGNDGVWANLNAKPRPGEELEEKPPTYEQAAADATPPYWETTVLSPYSITGNPDDVFIDGLLVGSLFSFVWNALISMSFQLIGFLLTYLLHTTHAAKHGSRAGLGITLVQYGFSMRYATRLPSEGGNPVLPPDGVPSDPNAHDFDPSTVAAAAMDDGTGLFGLSTTEWLSYALMIVGWFVLIRALSDFLRARRQEAIVRSSPDRGLGTAVVAEGEPVEAVV